MCLIDNTHLTGLHQWNPLDRAVRGCFCSGKGRDGLCNCERQFLWPFGKPSPETAVVPSNWKPRVRVKAISKRW